jgi:hypothetical protein
MTDTANQIQETAANSSGDSFPPKQCYEPDTYYQILEIRPPNEKEKRVGKNIATTIVAKQRGTGKDYSTDKKTFDNYKIDSKTKEKLKYYYPDITGDNDILSSYLPSPGIIFPDGFIKSLTKNVTNQTELNNFHGSLRDILISRKLSQLIAKTWWAYLQAKKKECWDKFTDGKWDKIDTEILDGLIAREIFLLAGQQSPDNPDPDDPSIYTPLKGLSKDKKARFLILPSCKSWQGINMSLLFSGQAYYKIGEEYHQISQPIMSTGEIVFNYSFESDWSKFNGEIKELSTNQESPWIVSQAVIPYPPIPSNNELDINDIYKWAEAEDEGGELPFYKKINDHYLMDADYFRAPYPYIPLSTC